MKRMPRLSNVTPAFREFFRMEAAGGIVLLAAALVAILWANSPWQGSYTDLLSTRLSFGFGDDSISKSIASWVKDGLMVIFFFLVGLEIKRELLLGELNTRRKAILPVAAAAGGAIVPAVIFFAMNQGTDGARGWGVPMATDIAFALGVLALISGPGALLLRVFLAALAIVDDLLAVLVVAVFYSDGINWGRMAISAGIFAGLIAMNRLGVNNMWAYVIGGFALWVAFLDTGVHTTVAGVLLAATIPARDPHGMSHQEEVSTGHSLLHRFEHGLHPWVAFGIMPVFALANAGVRIEGSVSDIFGDRVTLGIILGLVIGKQIGITLATWAALRFNLASLPTGLTLMHVYAVSWLAGIGFTMSIFIAGLAFDDPAQLTSAKIGILAASTIAGAIGYVLVRRVSNALSVGQGDGTRPDAERVPVGAPS
jgi:NhaA family Na+:H+ antiporter